MRPYNEYSQFTPNPEGGAQSNATLFDNRQQKNSECRELRTWKQSPLEQWPCADSDRVSHIRRFSISSTQSSDFASSTRECELLRTGGHKSSNSANGTAVYLITSVSSPTLYYNTTKYDIKHHCLFLFSCKHINSCKNVFQGTYIHYSENKYIKQRCLFSVSFKILIATKNVVHARRTRITIKRNYIKHLFIFFKI